MKLRILFMSFVVAISSSIAMADDDHSKDKRRHQQVERSIAVDPAVTVSVCVMSGNINVQGWDKHEVRARSNEIAPAELRRAELMKLSGPAKKLEVVVMNKGENQRPADTCQVEGDVDLMVPRGASVYVQTGDGSISINEVASIYARSQIGNIDIEKATRSVEAISFSGDVSLRDSEGRVLLRSVGGIVGAENVRPSDAGDRFEASTISGEVELLQITYAQTNVRTGNGNVHFVGPLVQGGTYVFNTTSGDVTLSLPADASFKLNARVAADKDITTDFPLTLTSVTSLSSMPDREALNREAPKAVGASHKKTEAIPPVPPDPPMVVIVDPKVTVKVKPVIAAKAYMSRRVTAVCGTGASTINVASFSGTLHLEEN